MKKVISIIICILAICACLTGCGAKPPIMVSLNGGGISLSESTDKITVSELETKLKKVTLENSDKPLFDTVTVSENKGIFYNSYRFLATITPQKTDGELALAVTMPGTPSGVRNGITQGNQVIFPLADLSDSTELAAEFEENNIGVMVVIIVVLVVIMAAFFFFVKRGNGGKYGSY